MPVLVELKDIAQQLRKSFDPLTGRQVAQAAASAINFTLAKDRVLIGREIRKQYKMNVFDAKSEVPQTFANQKTLTGKLSGNAGFTPMEYFSVTGQESASRSKFKLKRATVRGLGKNGKMVTLGRKTTMQGGGAGASIFKVQIMAGKTTSFMHAFIANTKNGPMLMNRGKYNYRTTKLGPPSMRKPMTRLRTLSVWQEINSKGIKGKSEALLKLEFTKEYTRLLQVRMTGAGGWR